MSTPVSPPPVSVRPIAATLAVVVRGHEVLLVRRGNPPAAGRRDFPGGKIDASEPLAATITALLPRLPVVDSVRQAKTYLSAALAHADRLDVGHGHGPVHHFHAWWLGGPAQP